MSREREKMIFLAALLAGLAISVTPRRAAESLSLDLQPVVARGAALFLSRRRREKIDHAAS
jgi:hypothetical protein